MVNDRSIWSTIPSLQKVLKYRLPYTDDVHAINPDSDPRLKLTGWNPESGRKGKRTNVLDWARTSSLAGGTRGGTSKAGKRFGYFALLHNPTIWNETVITCRAWNWQVRSSLDRSLSSSWKFLAIMICSHARQHSRPESDGVWWYVCQPPASGKSMDKCPPVAVLIDPSERLPVGHSTLGPKEFHFLRNSTCWTIVRPRSVWSLVCGEAVLIVLLCYTGCIIVWLVLLYKRVVSVSRV